jgi:porphobilinogen synthase
MVSETSLAASDLVSPIFANEGLSAPRPISSMPGVSSFPLEDVAAEARRAEELGIPAVLLFGVPRHKDEAGSQAWDEAGVVQEAVRSIKRECRLTVITDLCLCEYTSHGHCGVLRGEVVDNDRTLELYSKVAVSQARAGADMVAPSGMMDGQVRTIRAALDQAGFQDVGIMAYAAKFASAFYGPFREAAESAPQFGDRRTHQMQPGNAREALREMELDLEEGADILMVKPALPYLDVIALARQRFHAPLAAYSVSGEYAMLEAAAANGWLDRERAIMEALLGIKRAGADIIITYHALEAARLIREGEG